MEEKKYRILQVHNYYQIPGGEDTVVANEKELLEKNGHTVIQYTRNNSELKSFGLFRKLQLPFTSIFSLKTYKEIQKIIESEHIDVVHVHNTLSLISPSVYYAAVKKAVPVVQTIHNFRLLCPGATFYRDGHICEDCLTKGLGCALKHKCYRGSWAQTLICVINTKIHKLTGIYGKLNYICLTDFNKEKLLNLDQIQDDKVFVKPNFTSEDVEAKPITDRKDQIVFVGRLEEIKGVKQLLTRWLEYEQSTNKEAVTEKENTKLVLCGKGPLEDWCWDFVNKNKLKKVDIRGFVPNEEVKKIIAESKALILPSQWYEGFPMTIVEAYSVGTPVIGSDFGNVGDLITEGRSGIMANSNLGGKTGIKADFNTEGILKEILEKLDDSSFNSDYVSDFCNINYSAEANFKKLCDIYSNILTRTIRT